MSENTTASPQVRAWRRILLFRRNQVQFGVDLLQVDEVIPRVHVKPLPGVSPLVDGVIDFHGEPVPVVQWARLLPESPFARKPIGPLMMVLNGNWGRVALYVDEVEEIIEPHQRDIVSEAPIPETLKLPRRMVGGTVRHEDTLVPVLQLEELLGEQTFDALLARWRELFADEAPDGAETEGGRS